MAAKTNITFKILYNDAVAMTGGQPAEGAIDPARITRQLSAEAVGRIALVSDDPEKWEGDTGLAENGVDGASPRRAGRRPARMREIPGVTAIVYEQTCAAELRRRRKIAKAPDPDRRLFINSRVCEGCGDCSVQSNCIAIEPLDTEFGRKRKINQSACNKDFSCVKGFCPSFMEIDGPVLRKPRPPTGWRISRPKRCPPSCRRPWRAAALTGDYNIYVAGIGGLGVLTIGALLGVAAHLEGEGRQRPRLYRHGAEEWRRGQPGGAAGAPRPSELHALRIGPGEADLMLATDMVASSASLTPSPPCRDGRSGAVINLDVAPTAAVVARP